MRYYFKIPLMLEHTSHPVGKSATVSHYVDGKVIDKIHELVSTNITNPVMVSKCLEQYVEKELFGNSSEKPSKSNRRYYPSRQDLRNHIAKAISVNKYSCDDQESLRVKVDEWKKKSPNSNYFLRTRDEVSGFKETKFLFVHQEEWQRKLLLRYGGELVLMDATYKTTKYAIPLFFVCVHGNTGYTVVAEFMCQNEDSASIEEVLGILKIWNPSWNPKYFMVDYSLAEIDAIEKSFPEVSVYICDFHRIQAWQRWSKAGKNGLNHDDQQEFVRLMQKIAYANTVTQFDKNVEELRKSHVYHDNPKVRNYSEKVWLQCSSRWAHAFRKQQIANIVNTNNGVERQNHLFKYNYLPRSIDKSIYGIAIMLVESFIPDSYQRYMDTNLRLSSCYRKYNPAIPKYLHNRPPQFVKHCLKSNFASAEYKQYDIRCVNHEKGEFLVRSSRDSDTFYALHFGQPSCQCESWRKTQYPCKHFYAIFNFFEEWNFSRLPEFYKNSVFITLHTEHLTTAPTDITTDEQPSQRLVDSFANDRNGSNVNLDSKTKACADHNDITESDSLWKVNSLEEPPQKEEKDISKETLEPSSLSNPLKLRKLLLGKIDSMKNLIFLIDDANVLQDATSAVDAILANVQEHCPEQNGIPLRQSPVKKKLKKTSVDYHKVFHKKLPMRKKFSKKATNVRVIDLTDEESTTPITTEEVSNPVNCTVSYLFCCFFYPLCYFIHFIFVLSIACFYSFALYVSPKL